MKKSTKVIASIAMAAVMGASSMTALAVSAESAGEMNVPACTEISSAKAGISDGFGSVFEEVLNHKKDKNAPNVSITLLNKLIPTYKSMNMYNIKKGKYYIIRDHKQIGRHSITKYRLVKVKDVYEDPTWYGSERTVVVRCCDTGKTKKIQPEKMFREPTLFYEVNDFLIK